MKIIKNKSFQEMKFLGCFLLEIKNRKIVKIENSFKSFVSKKLIKN